MSTRRARRFVLLMVSVLLIAAIVAPVASAARKKPKKEQPVKVEICHREGPTGLYHKIVVSENALPAHLAHGDVLVSAAASAGLDAVCGCLDTDEDGTPDISDLCPEDPLKIEPGLCGCGVPDTDTDADLTPDCLDLCPADPLKVAPGACGCGVPDVDADNDGTADCLQTP